MDPRQCGSAHRDPALRLHKPAIYCLQTIEMDRCGPLPTRLIVPTPRFRVVSRLPHILHPCASLPPNGVADDKPEVRYLWKCIYSRGPELKGSVWFWDRT